MGRLNKKVPKLNEVKAVLQRLQGFPEEEAPAGSEPPGNGPRRSRGGAIFAAIVFVQALAIVVAVYVFSRPDPLATVDPHKAAIESAEPGKSLAKSASDKATLAQARSLMAKGQVRAARIQLLALARKGSPDAAWDAARSYDPNVLATIPDADADPDIDEATLWYRTWYDTAVKEGMVADSVSVERIIGAMRSQRR
jgi:hypothetical protein